MFSRMAKNLKEKKNKEIGKIFMCASNILSDTFEKVFFIIGNVIGPRPVYYQKIWTF